MLSQLYFIWAAASHKGYEWMVDILHDVEDNDHHGVVEMHCFITQFFQQFDLRTTMLVSESRSYNGRARAHPHTDARTHARTYALAHAHVHALAHAHKHIPTHKHTLTRPCARCVVEVHALTVVRNTCVRCAVESTCRCSRCGRQYLRVLAAIVWMRVPVLIVLVAVGSTYVYSLQLCG